MKVGVVGLGLIGGSLARDLSAAGHTVYGTDRSASAVRAARRARAIAGDLGRNRERLAECDAVVIGVPVDVALETLSTLAPLLEEVPLVSDVGSTKASIVALATRLGLSTRFVGAHPLTGDHDSGWSASRKGLFAGARVYLTPCARTGAVAMKQAKRLWRSVGAKPISMSAAEHDRLLSVTSHLPQVTALALALLLADSGIPRGSLGRAGREMTRLAASNPAVWAAILADNQENVAARIRGLRQTLEQVEKRVSRGDVAALRRLLTRTNRWSSS